MHLTPACSIALKSCWRVAFKFYPQLVALINRDYADFVNLSSKLIGVDEMAAALEQPLAVVSESLDTVRAAVVPYMF